MAERSNLTIERCVELIDGADPSISEIIAIAKGLNVSPRTLIVQGYEGEVDNVRFRFNFDIKRNALARLEYGEALKRMGVVSEIYRSSRKTPFFLDYPRNAAGADELSNIIRVKFLNVSEYEPLKNIDELAFESFGIVTLIGSYRAVEGAALRKNSNSVIILSQRNDMRMRFTLAHELAHLLCDIDEEAVISWADEDVLRTGVQSRNEERFANAFASCLMLPRAGVVMSLRESRRRAPGPPEMGITAFDVATLAHTFGTSFFVAARRLEMLGFYPPGSAFILEAAIRKKAASAEKFARSIGFPAREGHVWSNVARSIMPFVAERIDTGELSHEEAAFTLGIDLPTLMGLEHGRSYH